MVTRRNVIACLGVATALAMPLRSTAQEFGDMEIASIAESDGETFTRHDPPERPTANTPSTQPVEATDWKSSERLAGDWQGTRSKLDNAGIAVESSLTLEAFKNTRGGVDTAGSSFQHLLNFNISVDTERLFKFHGGTFFTNFQNQSGASPNDEVGAYQSLSPIDADGRTQISEIWYQQLLLEDKLRIKVGKIDVNTEFSVCETGSEFRNGGLNVSPNIPLPTYPDPAFGALMVYNFSERFYVGGGVFDGAAQEGKKTGELGPATLFGPPSDLYLTLETGGSWTLHSNLKGRAIAGLWHVTGTIDRFDGGTENGTSGVYAVVEQMLTNTDPASDDLQGLGVFLMTGYANAAVSEIPWHVSGGAVYHGPLPGRSADSAGVSATYVKFSDSAGFASDFECACEAFYEFRPIRSIAIKPDVQYIVHPGGAGTRDAIVVGVSMTVDF